VEISRILHPELKDTTSRQAFIASEAVQALVTFLRNQTRLLEEKIRTEISEPRWKATKVKKAIELERARLHSLGIMSFGLAHEMRQPLQTIRAEAGNIVTRLLSLGIKDADIEESQSAIDENITRMDDTINLIADIARGDLEHVESLDLAEIIRKESQVFARQSASLGIDVQLDVPEKQDGTLSRAAVLTVLLNLWKNSVEAIQALNGTRPGKVVISLSKGLGGHIISVADNGVGIPEDTKPKLFKKFATEKTGGLGVALYYCNLIIKVHGGTIECESQLGVGATFRVTVPDRN
jgi:two-component system sensor histidine kinase AtoS